MAEEEGKKMMALPNERRITTKVDEQGNCTFVMEEKFDYLPEPDRIRVTKSSVESMQFLEKAGAPVKVFERDGWVVFEAVLPRAMVADMLISELLAESSIGQLTIADLMASTSSAIMGATDRGEIAKMLTPEEGMEKFKPETPPAAKPKPNPFAVRAQRPEDPKPVEKPKQAIKCVKCGQLYYDLHVCRARGTGGGFRTGGGVRRHHQR